MNRRTGTALVIGASAIGIAALLAMRMRMSYGKGRGRRMVRNHDPF